MIKFFRKIRQRLLSESKFSKYLIYAIGEIVLVIIGILFALQINNWNSTNKAYQQELELYAKLLDDINGTFRSTQWRKADLKNYQDVYIQVYNEAKGRAAYDPNTSYSMLQWAYPYDALLAEKHSESLSKITNDSIRDLLKDLIWSENITSDAYTGWNGHKKESLWPFFKEYGIHNTDAAFNDRSYNFWTMASLSEIIDHSRLMEQYGSIELDEILFDLRIWSSWAYAALVGLEGSNNDLERALVRALTQGDRTDLIKRIPRKRLSDLLASGRTIDELVELIKSENKEALEYQISNLSISVLADELIHEERFDDALKLLKLNTELHPENSASWESYGQQLVSMGEVEEGIMMYKRSLDLNPKNSSAKRELEALEHTE